MKLRACGSSLRWSGRTAVFTAPTRIDVRKYGPAGVYGETPVCAGFSKDRVVEYIGDRNGDTGDGGVSYVKWDMNRSISDLFSAGRDARYQGTVYHRQIRGVYKLYERLTRISHVLFESLRQRRRQV